MWPHVAKQRDRARERNRERERERQRERERERERGGGRGCVACGEDPSTMVEGVGVRQKTCSTCWCYLQVHAV